jgi:hypothetical protein
MDIDIFINVINNTLLSPTFCAFIPLSFYGQVRSFLHPTVYISTAWTALIIIIGKFHHTSLHLLTRADMHSHTPTYQPNLYQPIIMATCTVQAQLEQANRLDHWR